MKRLTAITLVLLLTFTLFSCSKSIKADEETAENIIESGAVSDSDVISPDSSSHVSEVPMESKGESSDSYTDEAEGSIIETGDTAVSEDYSISGAIINDNSFIADTGDAKADAEIPIDTSQIQSGTLTAGEWKDAKNLNFWTEVLNRSDWKSLTKKRNLHTNNVVTVQVADENGNPCFNTTVSLLDSQNNVIYTAVSDVSGYAYLLYNLNTSDKDAPAFVTVGTDKPVEISKNGITKITLKQKSHNVTKLDLMLMIDTTGSMGDELEYLKEELHNVVSEVAKTSQALSINVSVNFYRDTGDEYEVKEFPFTSDITKATEQLNDQYANGGGDYPEAVHKALNSVVFNHEWREDSVKLCFFVLDAPPHNESEIQSINSDMQKSVQEMAKQGIRLIPVASSGVDTETEFLCRSWALMTGGTYTFLTDHSGVGGSHLEPTIGDYEVEKLNALMIRIIKEYCNIK